MRPELEKEIREEIDRLQGWTHPTFGMAMANMIVDRKFKLVVELGVFGGRSFIPQVMAMKEAKSGVVIGIDPWFVNAALECENEANQNWWKTLDLEMFQRAVIESITRNDLWQWGFIIRSYSHVAAPIFQGIDMLNIDGNHSEEVSCRDVQCYLPRVVMGGYVWMDDTDWPSTQKAIGMVEEKCTLIENHGNRRLYIRER